MSDAIGFLRETPIPTILVIAGLFFLFLAIGGQFGAKIVTDKVKQRYAALIGVVLILVGLVIFLSSRPSEEPPPEYHRSPEEPPPEEPWMPEEPPPEEPWTPEEPRPEPPPG